MEATAFDPPSTLNARAEVALQKGDYALALALFEKLALLGSELACYIVADIYLFGGGKLNADPTKAETWLQKALESTDPKLSLRAALKLGYMYQYGYGVTRNEETAYHYYKKLEESNNAIGLLRLAYMYQEGLGTSIDLSVARRLYRRSAELGNLVAKKHFGLMELRHGSKFRGRLNWMAATIEIAVIRVFHLNNRRIRML